jgi:hypothetical protein
MKAIGIDAADGQEADLAFFAERHQRGGAHFVRFAAEQEVALGIAHLAAARLAAAEKRGKRTQGRIVALDGAKEAPDLGRGKVVRIAEEHQYRLIGTERWCAVMFR